MTRSTSAEKEKKPMLDLDALEVGFYAKGRDGNFYKVDLPVDFSFTKTINVLTGEIHYPNNYARLKSMSMEEMAEFIAKFHGCSHCPGFNVPCDNRCQEYWLDWLKEEVSE